MSHRNRKLESKLKAVPVPIALVRAAAAGEIVANLGGDTADVELVQKAIVRNLIDSVHVYGVDKSGHAREQVELSLDPNNARGDLLIDPSQSATTIEALDRGLAAAVAHKQARFEHQGLVAKTFVTYSQEVSEDPDRLTAAREELGTAPGFTPDWADGHEPRPVASVKPGKDKGLKATFLEAFKKKS